MKFDKNRKEATNGAKGICPSCGSELIARCGEIKINHWAHKGRRNCDPWWENETVWHRSWKNEFPGDWQEKEFKDKQSGGTHIADICTGKGFVIEFQHSFIKPEERVSRENFYKNMVWIVDGTRLKNDYKRFQKGLNGFRRVENKPGHYYSYDYPEEIFSSNWTRNKIPVIFDFKGMGTIEDPADFRNFLIYLFPYNGTRQTEIAFLARGEFIKSVNENGWVGKEPQKEKKIPQEEKRKAGLSIRSKVYYDEKGSYTVRLNSKGKFVKYRRF